MFDLCTIVRALPAALLAAAVLLLPTSASAQRELQDIPPPDPELERASFQVAEGFEVNLFAADPRIAKPIQMNFDAAGRLWIASSEIYPHILPGQESNDKIVVLEDADGDGQAERTTVFADGLLIPTGVEPGDGGAYVANSTELVHLQDTDGDGRADRRRVLLSGFGTEDTHHILHTLRFGPEGLLYFNQSIYIHSHVETPYGVRRLGGGGIWHFRPETSQLEIFARGFVNPWGHHFDAWGQSFATDGAFGEGINYVFPGATFCTAPGAKRILKGLNPGSPKHCGLEIVDGRHLPDDWQGNMVTNDFRAHRVCRFVISEDRSGYASREQVELIKTTHVAFRPIDVKMGPDGAIYIADWYNPIIQHGEVDFRDPRRDHVHGRIWRVTAKGRPLVPRPQLVGAPPSALVAALGAPEAWTRHHAKRLLKERGPAVLDELRAWVASRNSGDPRAEHDRLEALWTFQALDIVEPELLAQLLASADARVRAAATRVVYHWHERLPDPLTALAAAVADDHPRVRLEAIRALAQIPRIEAVELALSALARPMDENLDFALWSACRELEDVWLPRFAAGKFDFHGDVRAIEFALRAAESGSGIHSLVALLQAGKVPHERLDAVLGLIASLGSAEEMGLVLQMAVIDRAAPASRQISLLSKLTAASRERKLRPAGDLAQLSELLAADDPLLRAAAARAAGAWQVEPLRARLTELANADKTNDPARRAAIEALADLGGAASLEALDALAAPGRDAQGRLAAARTLVAIDPARAAARAVELLADQPPEQEVATLVEAFLARKGSPAMLATALAGKQLPSDAAKCALRVARSSARPDESLVEALRSAGGLAVPGPPPTPEQIERLVADVREQGDPARGEAVFRGRELGCLKCHAIGGAGGLVGPDLISVGSSAQIDYLVESILLPNKAIKENYHSLVVATGDGRVFTGVKVRQTDKHLILRDAEDREVAIGLDAVEEQAAGGSLMPAGLADTVTRAELVHLVRFLSELGKAGPYAVGGARVVRRWQVLEPTPEVLERARRDSVAAAVNDGALPWTSAYSLVSGALPLAAVPKVVVREGAPPVGMLRFAVQVNQAGRVGLRLNSSQALSLWVDGAPHAMVGDTLLDLGTGEHTLALVVQLDERQEDVRIELVDVADSPAKAQLVGGK